MGLEKRLPIPVIPGSDAYAFPFLLPPANLVTRDEVKQGQPRPYTEVYQRLNPASSHNHSG